MNKSYTFIAIDSFFREVSILGFFLQFFSCLSVKTNSFSQNWHGVFCLPFFDTLDFVILAFLVLALDFALIVTSSTSDLVSAIA